MVGESETEANRMLLQQRQLHLWTRCWKKYPNSQLKTSGEDVGLPAGQMGNSEVGHLNIGAGRVVLPGFGEN